MQMAKENDL